MIGRGDLKLSDRMPAPGHGDRPDACCLPFDNVAYGVSNVPGIELQTMLTARELDLPDLAEIVVRAEHLPNTCDAMAPKEILYHGTLAGRNDDNDMHSGQMRDCLRHPLERFWLIAVGRELRPDGILDVNCYVPWDMDRGK
jgi:hypothetical protein